MTAFDDGKNIIAVRVMGHSETPGIGDKIENVQKNYAILGKAIGFDPKKSVHTKQTHTDIVRVVTEADCNGLCHRDYPECDALVTNSPGVTLLVFTADCTPILLHDPVTGAVGAAHAGWRGTARQIGAKTVEAMIRHFGSKPEDIRAAIGPNLSQCHFETDMDVPAALTANYGTEVLPFIRQKGAKYAVSFVALPIADAAKFTRSVPKEFIAKNGHDVTPSFIRYASPLVGELPACEIF